MSYFDNAPIEVRRAYDNGKWWGAYEERERIIALLESIRQGDEWIGREYAIALIKGEQK